MDQQNQRASQRAHENARRPAEEYDDEGRPAAARARDADPGPQRRGDQLSEPREGNGSAE